MRGMRILILHAHPRPSASIAQRALLAAVQGLPNVTTHDLYAAYPDFAIDAAAEQQRLLQHDLIVLQHPFYWYSAPAIIKEWLDIVLDFGWAYGPGGNKLHGKFLLSAISTGGAHHFYSPQGRNRFTVEELLSPFNQTAHLCGMGWLSPFVVFEGRRLESDALKQQAGMYRELLQGLSTGIVDVKQHIAPGYKLPASFMAPAS